MMKNSLKHVVQCCTLLLLLSLKGVAQSLPEIQNSFESYSRHNLQEKLFVHTDRQNYLAGEIIWFKIYAADGTYNKPLDFSKVAYVEVLDSKQTPVLQAKIAMNHASGSGSLVIPISIANGNYKLRAYTSWMKNYGADYYFEKAITIVNTQRNAQAGNGPAKADYDVQFFPEGGTFINGLKGKVAFKAIGADGKGIKFKGAIIDQNHDTVLRFAPLKFGMGSFMFTPAKGSSYTAIIQPATGNKINKAMPDAANEGYALSLTDNGNGLDINVKSTNTTGVAYVLVHTRQALKLAKEVNLDNGSAHLAIDKNMLGEGISHITVFNHLRQPVCERLYFKRPTEKLSIIARPDLQQYATRKKLSVTVLANDAAGKPINADLSLSVYRIDAFQTPAEGDILSYLWLSSDLQGRIEEPAYYFADKSVQASEAADNLMLTQGWRRFDWKQVTANKPAVFGFLPELYGHIVAGKIVNATTNQPAAGILTYLAVPGKAVQLAAAQSDSAGNVLFNTKNLYSSEIAVQTNTQLDTGYRIDIIKPFSEQFTKTQLAPFGLDTSWQASLKKQSVAAQVLNIYWGDKVKQFYAPLQDSAGFYNKPVNTYLLDNYTRFTTMEEVLREYIREVNITRVKKKFHIKVIGPDSFLDGDPLVLIDGVPVFDMDKVMAADPLLIRKLEVTAKRYLYGPSLHQGVFSFTSYKGNLGGLEIDPRALVVDYEGLQNQRIFYSPAYETESQKSSPLPDFRNLLFWSPVVLPNSNTPVSFYTSDQAGKYIGIIQGMGTNGEVAASSFSFEVK